MFEVDYTYTLSRCASVLIIWAPSKINSLFLEQEYYYRQSMSYAGVDVSVYYMIWNVFTKYNSEPYKDFQIAQWARRAHTYKIQYVLLIKRFQLYILNENDNNTARWLYKIKL
jgi:hypothetical protein